MLTSLEIKDYALIEKIHVKFNSGLNIITGETGAGKSILIGALGLLLGERASTETVRKGADKSVIEGIFEIGNNKKVSQLLKENELEVNPELILRREISIKGTNRCFVNDTPVQLTLVKQIGNLLIDLHGQHDHQSLLRNETHIEFLDEFCDLENDLAKYTELKKQLNEILSQISLLKANEKSLKEKSELYQFQLKEINAVSPFENEDVNIEKELLILENSEKLFEISSQIYSTLYDDENSVFETFTQIQNNIAELKRIDECFNQKFDDANSALEILKDIAYFTRDYKDKIDIDPDKIEELRNRAGAIHLLKKKYGGTLENVLKHKAKIEDELNIAENFSERLEGLLSESNKVREKIKGIAVILSDKRKKESDKVEKEIIKMLSFLGINDSKFKINFSFEQSVNTENYIIIDSKNISLHNNGIDVVEFYISTNLGEDLKPLSKIASGGEISRVMLAIKSVLAKTEKLPLLIFDEIDTGVSGRIAQKVGKVLSDLSKSHQIISITHLAQIAAYANHHFSISKELKGERVISKIIKLDEETKIKEVAKLLSGENITQSNIDAAKELINFAASDI
ncbi:MAG: DNA repair protein RecN [Ignavibacteriales bacterium]|nr:DNA repair protein RecN [Ignavibacteriales bacterium]